MHSSLDHLLALCKLLKEKATVPVFIHGFTDGRDCSPNSGLFAFQELSKQINGSSIKVASIIGRYYAMDRDQRWERIKKAYDLLVKGQGEVKQNYESVFQDSYEKGITDEFIEPSLLHGVDGEINDEDVVLCFNFRTDRCRQITSALTQKDFLSYGMEKLNLHYFTMTNYDRNFQNVNVVYDKENLSMTIGEVLSNSSKTQLRIAETEKYPHVTYFFSGGKESTFPKESRIVVASLKLLHMIYNQK